MLLFSLTQQCQPTEMMTHTVNNNIIIVIYTFL